MLTVRVAEVLGWLSPAKGDRRGEMVDADEDGVWWSYDCRSLKMKGGMDGGSWFPVAEMRRRLR
jgi:hypothetical protein